jgi:isopenicillin N synthase-like dioxygenase
MQVAVVDYRAQNADELFATSLRETGFAVLVNHPVANTLVKRVHDEWLAFFENDAKHAYKFDNDQDGYFPPDVSEVAKGAQIRDLKEFFHVYPWGKYPNEVGSAARELYAEATDVARTLLGWVERHSPPEVAAGYSMPLSQMLDNNTRTLLRILRYPPLRGDEPAGAVRAAAHEDINLITVLPAANEPGLQVLDAHGGWHEVPCDFGSLTINVGDMLQLASNGFYPSTTHRVVNPIGASAARSRMSTPLFLHPANQVILADGRTAEDFLAERIRILRGERN